MDPLISKRAILLTAMKEMLDLADAYGNNRPASPYNYQQHRYFTLEAARIGVRLMKIQKQIEDNDLD